MSPPRFNRISATVLAEDGVTLETVKAGEAAIALLKPLPGIQKLSALLNIVGIIISENSPSETAAKMQAAQFGRELRRWMEVHYGGGAEPGGTKQ